MGLFNKAKTAIKQRSMRKSEIPDIPAEIIQESNTEESKVVESFKQTIEPIQQLEQKVDPQSTIKAMKLLPQTRPDEEPLVAGSKEYKLWKPVSEVDQRDADTPDKWIPRHKDLIRLTGRHPFNSEPPLQTAMNNGFLIPVSEHFVRNHGPCQNIDWDKHRVEVNGLVKKPTSFSMDDLVTKFKNHTFPVTLVCCGNRRKEVNVVKKSMGFSWGATAISTNEWTGVKLADVLKECGIENEDPDQFVLFRGPLGELPKGDDGSYGTQMRLSYAMDPANDVILAFKQNGRYLHPDHGFPVRIIIPGWIGGRMVKWLSELTVSKTESTNYFHFHDNKVLPPFVSEELAVKDGWWLKPEYILYDLNINSVISSPSHDERVYLDENKPYEMKGYAYSGGGRKINRVEVSLDGGETWKVAELNIFENPNAYGKYWCWCHWSFSVTTLEMMHASELICRAWDYGQNTQPATLTWTLLGQGNNCYFRLKVHQEVDDNGKICLRFQEPAPMLPGPLGNKGWMEDMQEEGSLDIYAPGKILKKKGTKKHGPMGPPKRSAPRARAAKPAAALAQAPAIAPSNGKLISMAEIEKHTTEESAWFVHEGKVYDATAYLDDHPGGAQSIIISSGIDCTEEFNSIHSQTARGMLAKYYIGDVAPDSEGGAAGVAAVAAADDGDLVALKPRVKQQFPLIEKIVLSHNTRLFRFGLPTPEHRLGLPIGQHIFVYVQHEGKPVMRAYTPSSSDSVKGYFDLVVKVYWANEHPKFPDGGIVSQALEKLNIGDNIDVKGPLGEFTYLGRGKYKYGKREGVVKKINMIAGGTGITPMYQIMQEIFADSGDTTQVSLLYANQSEDDILLREDLDKWDAAQDNLKVWYTLDRAPAVWKYSTGFICEDMMRSTMFESDEDTLVLMCGPPPMLKFACVPNLLKLGFEESSQFVFF